MHLGDDLVEHRTREASFGAQYTNHSANSMCKNSHIFSMNSNSFTFIRVRKKYFFKFEFCRIIEFFRVRSPGAKHVDWGGRTQSWVNVFLMRVQVRVQRCRVQVHWIKKFRVQGLKKMQSMRNNFFLILR